METLIRRRLEFVGLFLLWLLLTWSFGVQEVVAGIIVAAIAAILLSKLLPAKVERLFNPVRWFWALLHLVSLAWWIILANFDVMYRVLHPNLPIRPGIVKVKTSLVSDEARTFLANSITLTPGTLSVDIIDDRLYVHWINVHENIEDTEAITREIAGRFEKTLRRVFD